MNNKGQIAGIVVFVGIVISIIIMAPIVLKVGGTLLSSTATSLGNFDTSNKSVEAVTTVKDKITGSFDWMVMLLVIFNILLLLFSAFMIDVHPAFVVLYIFGAFILVLTLPFTNMAAERLYDMSTMSEAVSYLPMTQFLVNNFSALLVGVIVLSGIVMYAKFRFSSQNTGGGY